MASLLIVWHAISPLTGAWADYFLVDTQSREKNKFIGPLDQGITNLATAQKSEVPIVRASSPQLNDRQNFSNRISFVVERELDSFIDALKFKSDYPQSIPREGKYREAFTAADGSQEFREMSKAVMDAPQIIASNGVVLQVRFSISGNLFTSALSADT